MVCHRARGEGGTRGSRAEKMGTFVKVSTTGVRDSFKCAGEKKVGASEGNLLLFGYTCSMATILKRSGYCRGTTSGGAEVGGGSKKNGGKAFANVCRFLRPE